MFNSLSLFQMIEALFGIRTVHHENPVTDNVDIAVTNILSGNPRRVGFVVFNLSANTIFIAPSNIVSATRGIYLAPNGGSASLVWDRDFEIICMPWYAAASADTSVVYILEYISQ